MWNERYSAPGYLFGVEPALFLQRERARLAPGLKALAVADGEGRNSVFMAAQGLEVDAFDASEVGVEKAKALAAERGVDVAFHLAGIEDWPWTPETYDLVVAIFIQFAAPAERGPLFENMKRTLKLGGTLLLHGYRPKQIEYGTGGPPHAENMYTNYPTILSPYRDPKQIFYGPLGNRLAYGRPAYDWVETKGLGVQARGSSSQAITGDLYNYPGREQTTYRRYFEDVLTVSEHTNRWSAGVTIAQELRGRFTPLTLKVNAFPGFRLDVSTKQSDFSALFMTHRTYRMGAFHLKRSVGLLDFGLTYVNAHESFSDQYGNALSRDGVLRHNQPFPEIIAVKFSDDLVSSISL